MGSEPPRLEYRMENEDAMRKRQRKLERNKERAVNYMFTGEAKTNRELKEESNSEVSKDNEAKP
jgi:hypothetical protein